MREEKNINRLIGIDKTLYKIYSDIQKMEEKGICNEPYIKKQIENIFLCIEAEKTILDDIGITEDNLFTYLNLLNTENSISLYPIVYENDIFCNELSYIENLIDCVEEMIVGTKNPVKALQYNEKRTTLIMKSYMLSAGYPLKNELSNCVYPQTDFMAYTTKQVIQEKTRPEKKWETNLKSLMKNTITHPILMRIYMMFYNRLYDNNIIQNYYCDAQLCQFINDYPSILLDSRKESIDLDFILMGKYNFLAKKKIELVSKIEQRELSYINQMIKKEQKTSIIHDLYSVKYMTIFSNPNLEADLLNQGFDFLKKNPSKNMELVIETRGGLGEKFASYHCRDEVINFLKQMYFLSKKQSFSNNLNFFISMFRVHYRVRVSLIQEIDFVMIKCFIDTYFSGIFKNYIYQIIDEYSLYEKNLGYQKIFT